MSDIQFWILDAAPATRHRTVAVSFAMHPRAAPFAACSEGSPVPNTIALHPAGSESKILKTAVMSGKGTWPLLQEPPKLRNSKCSRDAIRWYQHT